MQAKYEVADVLRLANTQTETFTIHQQKTLRALQQCRTAALGGHIDACGKCGNVSISYNSCRNRHCPKCQGHKREEWIQRREADLLPCTYYHVVFTLPQQLNALALHRPAFIYDALFQSVWQTGRWQKQLRSNKYLFAVKALSKVFRAKYVQQLRENEITDKSLIESLFAKDWVVYAKRPFGGPMQVIEYLGRYTHKVAISNHRIQEVTDCRVTFT